jgi:hypothetical protein
MTARVISIHDAKLKTVSVGIKAMTISDRLTGTTTRK